MPFNLNAERIEKPQSECVFQLWTLHIHGTLFTVGWTCAYPSSITRPLFSDNGLLSFVSDWFSFYRLLPTKRLLDPHQC